MASVFAFAGNVWADEQVEEKSWKSDMELGYVQTGGNTKTRSLNTKGSWVFDGESIRTTLKGSALNTSDRNSTTAELYNVSLQEDWKFTEVDYVFGRVGFDTDRFGGFKSRYSETLGYGRMLFKEDKSFWNMEIGAGARQTRLVNNSKKINELVGRASTTAHWQMSDSALFIQELRTEGGREGFVSNSLTALQNKLNGSLSSKISYSTQYTTKVPAGSNKTNTEISVSLVWSY